MKNIPSESPSVTGRTGIALGGGGARGWVHLGVLDVLWSRSGGVLLPDVVCGTSVGAIVGALYAAGLSPDRMEAATREMGWLSEVIDRRASLRNRLREWLPGARLIKRGQEESGGRAGLLSNEQLGRWIVEVTDCSEFRNLRRPMGCVATDIETGESVLMTESAVEGLPEGWRVASTSLPLAVRASAAIPGVFDGVPWEGRLLVDGGLVAQVPVKAVRAMGADRVLAVSLGSVERTARVRRPHEALINSLAILMERGIGDDCRGADLVVRPPGIDGVSLTDLDQRERLVDLGRRAMERALPEWERLVLGRD